MPLCTALGKEKMDDGARDSDQEEGHQHRKLLANLLLRLLNPLPLRAVCRERKDRQLLHRPEMAAHQRANLAEICDSWAPARMPSTSLRSDIRSSTRARRSAFDSSDRRSVPAR